MEENTVVTEQPAETAAPAPAPAATEAREVR